MVNIFNSFRLNNIFLLGTLTAFSSNVISVPPCHAIDAEQVAFLIRVEKLVEKAWKQKKQNKIIKVLETMINIKSEVEVYTGNKINIDKEIDQIEKDLKKKGANYSKNEFGALRKIIKLKDKKFSKKAANAEYRLLSDDVEPLCFDNQSLADPTKENKEQEDLEKQLPLRLALGVTICLCGVFLCFVPIPICKKYGAELIKGGIALAVEGYVNRQEENKDKDKNGR